MCSSHDEAAVGGCSSGKKVPLEIRVIAARDPNPLGMRVVVTWSTRCSAPRRALVATLVTCANGLVPLYAPRVSPRTTGVIRPTSTQLFAAAEVKQEESSLVTAAIVAGGAVGGGFLALPRATAGVGLVPSFVAIIASWLYMTACSVALAEGTVLARRAQEARASEEPEVAEAAADEGTSIFAVTVEALGRQSAATRAVLSLASTCFVLATLATLSAQIAKARSLAACVLPDALGFAATPAAAAAAYVLAFGVSARVAEKFSAILSLSMVVAFGILLKGIAVGADASAAMLATNNWQALVPWFADARMGDPWPVAVFCHLVCFGEVVAIACRRSMAKPSTVARPLVIGGSIPLLMALALVAAATRLPVDGLRDPLDILVSAGGFQAFSVVAFGACAIATTTIGTLLACSQFLTDLVCAKFGFCSLDNRRVVRILSVAVPALASYLDEDLFYKGLAFAGSYPVTILWGILPAFLLGPLRRRERLRRRRRDLVAGVDAQSSPHTALLPGGALALNVLKLLGLSLLGVNIIMAAAPGFLDVATRSLAWGATLLCGWLPTVVRAPSAPL